MTSESFERTGHKAHMRMYDVKRKLFIDDVEVELVKLSNGRFAVTGQNPETQMTMFKLVSKKLAQEISGSIEI